MRRPEAFARGEVASVGAVLEREAVFEALSGAGG